MTTATNFRTDVSQGTATDIYLGTYLYLEWCNPLMQVMTVIGHDPHQKVMTALSKDNIDG